MRLGKRAVIGSRRSRALACAAVSLVLVLAGCPGSERKKTEEKKPEEKKADAQSTGLRDQLYDLRVENQKLSNLVATLRAQKAKEEKQSPTGIASEQTQTQVAKAEVDANANFDELRKKLEELIQVMKSRGDAPPPPPLSPEDIQKIVEAVRSEHDAGTDGSTTRASEPAEGKGSSDSDEAEKAMKLFMKGIGLALCAAQPELCPLLGPIFDALNLFGSTEEREKYLGAVEAVAEGKPLTDAQAAVVKRVADEKYGSLREGARKVIEQMGEKSPEVAAALKQGREKLIGTLGISPEAYEELRQTLASGGSVATKLAKVQSTFPVFANPNVHKIVADLAEDLGGRELGKQVRELGGAK